MVGCKLRDLRGRSEAVRCGAAVDSYLQVDQRAQRLIDAQMQHQHEQHFVLHLFLRDAVDSSAPHIACSDEVTHRASKPRLRYAASISLSLTCDGPLTMRWCSARIGASSWRSASWSEACMRKYASTTVEIKRLVTKVSGEAAPPEARSLTPSLAEQRGLDAAGPARRCAQHAP